MKIGILGTGRVGTTLGRRWAEAGHDVMFGSREPQSERVQGLVGTIGHGVRAGNPREAIAHGEVLVLAIPWKQAVGILKEAADLAGKIVVDCINPLTDDFQGIALGFDTSAAEQIALAADGVRVVKAFNTVSTATMEDPVYAGQRASMFYCGDDVEAKRVIGTLAEQLGLEAVDAGPLKIARYLEPLAMLYIHLAVREGWGANCAFKILKR